MTLRRLVLVISLLIAFNLNSYAEEKASPPEKEKLSFIESLFGNFLRKLGPGINYGFYRPGTIGGEIVFDQSFFVESIGYFRGLTNEYSGGALSFRFFNSHASKDSPWRIPLSLGLGWYGKTTTDKKITGVVGRLGVERYLISNISLETGGILGRGPATLEPVSFGNFWGLYIRLAWIPVIY